MDIITQILDQYSEKRHLKTSSHRQIEIIALFQKIGVAKSMWRVVSTRLI